MNQPRFAIIGLLVGLAAATFTSTSFGQAAPSKIAVIDFRKAYVDLAETKATNASLAAMEDELKIKANSHKGQLTDLQSQIGQAKADSQKHQDLMLEFDTKSLQFDMEEKSIQIKMARTRGHQMKKAFDDISAQVAVYAKANGIDAVLVNFSPELPDNVGDMANQEQLTGAIFNRSFLYVSPTVDITGKIVTAVDAAAKATPAPAPAPGH